MPDGESFFTSRWVDRLDHVTVLPAEAGLPEGFRASGAAGGIKPGGALDVGIIACDAPEVTSAARFTRSAIVAAPVALTRDRCRLDALRAVVVNSGNANAATGGRGRDDAAHMQGSGAIACGAGREELVAVASTGVIGVPLPMREVTRGIAAAATRLRREGDGEFAEAIRTTDAYPKRASLSVALPSGTVRISAQAKGAGMISPRFATLLVFAQTDAAMSAETASLLLSVCVKRSFERISVDGQLSTNDTVILQCSGASRVRIEPETPDELAFGEALDVLMRQLAMLIIADGEGAKRIGRVHVRGTDESACERVARAVADSPLVKTALHGADPNWGRIVQAVGAALPGANLDGLEVAIEGTTVFARGGAARFDAVALAEAVRRAEVEYTVRLGGDPQAPDAEAEVFFSDLGHGYVTINAEYTT